MTKSLQLRLRPSLARLVAACLCGALLSGCASTQHEEPCATALTTRLYLGQDTPDGAVTDAQWERFLEESVTPLFPDGFTVLQGRGRWRTAAGEVQGEDTRVIEIVHDDSPAHRLRTREVGAAYQRRFAQHSVLVARAPTVQCLYSLRG